MPASRRALLAGLAGFSLVVATQTVRAMPASFAPLVQRVAPVIAGISVIRFAGSQPPSPPRLPLPRGATPGSQDYDGQAAVSKPAGSGIIVTNNHVVGTDQLTDIAIIKIDAGHPLPFAHWGNSARMEVGDWILAAGPASAAGLRPGDIVLAVNNLPVNDASALIRAIASVSPGAIEHLRVQRDGQIFGMSVTVGRRPAELGSD